MHESVAVMDMIVLFLLVSLTTCSAFLPNFLYQCKERDAVLKTKDNYILKVDHTHQSITEYAITAVVDELLTSSRLEHRGKWEVTRRQALQEILDGSRELDRIGHGKAAYHFNGEQLFEGNDQLIAWKDQIIELANHSSSPHKLRLIRHLIGQYLHLVQDFYSNTDKIEFAAGYENLIFLEDLDTSDGKLSGKRVDKARKRPFCNEVSVPYPDWENRGSLTHDGTLITSGYRAGQDIVKPRGIKSSRWNVFRGKCSHGGVYDSSSLLQPIGGINSESYNYLLSPMFFNHNKSAQAAIAASRAFLHSDLGLPAKIAKDDLLAILGVGAPSHVSIIQTATLLELANSPKWLDILNTYSSLWPWEFNHMYTRDSDRAATDLQIYKKLSTSSSEQVVSASQSSILTATASLPDHSQLVLVTSYVNPLEASWDEDLMTRVLAERHIRLVTFVKHSTPPRVGIYGADKHAALRRICTSTRGYLFYVKNTQEMLNLLVNMNPRQHTTYYAAGSALPLILLPATQTVSLVINCAVSQMTKESSIISNGTMTARVAVDTTFVQIYSLSSDQEQHQLVTVRLPDSLRQHCAVSTWSDHSIVDAYAVTGGARGQLYPSNTRVPGASRLVVETSALLGYILKPQNVGLSGIGVGALKMCPYNHSRRELHHTYMTEPIADRESGVMDIELMLLNSALVIAEPLTVQHVRLDAVSVISENDSSVELLVINNSSKAEYTFSILQQSAGSPANVSITPSRHTANSGNNFTVSLLFGEGYLPSHSDRPVIFVLEGEAESGEKFHAVHSFHIISLSRKPDTEKQSISTTDGSRPPPESPVRYTKSTGASPGITDASRNPVNGTTENRTIGLLLSSIFGTVLVLSTLIVLLATAILLRHYLHKRRPKSDLKVTSL